MKFLFAIAALVASQACGESLRESTQASLRGQTMDETYCTSLIVKTASSSFQKLTDGYSKYHNDMDLCFLIEAQSGRVEFEIDYYKLGSSIHDTLEIFDLVDTHSRPTMGTLNSVLSFNNRVAIFTGDSSRDQTFTSTGRFMVVRLHTDNAVVDGGFKGYYKKISVGETYENGRFIKLGNGACRVGSSQGEYEDVCGKNLPECTATMCAKLCEDFAFDESGDPKGCSGFETSGSASRLGHCEIHFHRPTRTSGGGSDTKCFVLAPGNSPFDR